MRKMFLFLSLSALAACAASVPGPRSAAAPALDAQAIRGIVLARQAAMHMSTTLMVKSVRPAVRSGSDVREQVAAAEGMAMWAEAIPGMFPPGSNAPDSRARPEIWTNKADFDAKAGAYREAALRLAELGRKGDTAGFAAQVEVVQARCGACHQAYRS